MPIYIISTLLKKSMIYHLNLLNRFCQYCQCPFQS
nr:MAG TPA: U1 small nuclear ribonucleoprotein [Caudoviricetes sp.]DAQ49203.1 MAG TPA: U1 small nuclear ribonucleoprotein [Caudoviricetes sp.]